MSNDAPASTFDPETHWQALKSAMEAGGSTAVVTLIEGLDDPSHQRQLYAFAVRAFDGRDWSGKNFDDEIAVARAAIDLGVAQAEQEDDPVERARRIEYSNVLSYNFAANLAPCWPGDERTREPRHFEAGLRAADDCLRWRRELGKGPQPFGIAHWARGIHLIALGRDAVADMQASLDYAIQDAEAQGNAATVSAAGGWAICLSAGYLGLAQRLAGQSTERYSEACAALAEMAQDETTKDDAEFCLSQLRVVEERFAGDPK